MTLVKGVLYGVPDVQGQIPASFYTGEDPSKPKSSILFMPSLPTGMGFSYLSAGAAQDPTATGWIYGGYTVSHTSRRLLSALLIVNFLLGTISVRPIELQDSTYIRCPVHPQDERPLGCRWYTAFDWAMAW